MTSNKKYKIAKTCTILLILFSLILMNAVAEETQLSIPDRKFTNIAVDSSVIEKLQNQTEVYVTVILKDGSNLTYGNTKREFSERRTIYEQKAALYKESQEEVISKLSKSEFQTNYRFTIMNAFSGNITKEGLEKLKSDPNVLSIEGTGMSALGLNESVKAIKVDPYVWDLGYTGDGITICVLDSGIAYTHPDLGNCTQEEFLSGTCDKIPGGYDFCATPGCSNEDANPIDSGGHGTKVAGIIASTNPIYKGVAPNSRLVAMKVCDVGGCDNTAMAKAVDWCVANASKYDIKVITISLYDYGEYNSSDCNPAGEGRPLATTAINNAYDLGFFVDAISGNDGHRLGISWPACTRGATSVGATTKTGYLWGNSNTYSNLDLLAPGVNIFSTSSSWAIGDDFEYDTATSFAAPHVAGAAALLYEFNHSLTPDRIKELLKETGTMVSGYPLINVKAAIDSLTGQSEPSGEPSNCTEPGYEQCITYENGTCDVSIAINRYSNVNNIRWGAVNDASDPYVIGNYTIGWFGVDANDVYYGSLVNQSCQYGGCNITKKVEYEGTKITVTAPEQAYQEMLLAYDEGPSTGCWAWFNDFAPNYGANNPIYVLNCYADSDCLPSQYCDQSGSWDDWACVVKKSDGQSCTLNQECASNYCDNDGVGLTDDNHCFAPHETYFDSVESAYCEISTGYGIPECDERAVGEEFPSCTQAGQSYFADQCSSTCGAAEASDHICRNESFAAGCSADPECNGVEAGTGACLPNCQVNNNAPTATTILNPNGGNIFGNNTIIEIEWTPSYDPDEWFVRYFLDYSNNSGTSWTNLVSNYGFKNTLNDSSSEKSVIFSGNENKTVYLRLPKNSEVLSATVDLTS
ncbi:MAG: S8 family serine peptidase [Candidatus Woesearchaeota archaeon]